ncbi:hypothetical protein K6Y31_06370 [Motilimonas cestriensis]|uniref:Uncharacterized protein n=1 Tax=Motilimonas cestriensis TaxID=2742685 RepID=A0ABS8W630_9GAMM|nr:hypothetical protein [Motilimonas cestriensis]MCE2594434.1 hypothetical protein [Motilimonas cestriensis]
MKTTRETRAEFLMRQRRIAQYMLEDGKFFPLARLIERAGITQTQAEVTFRYLENNPDIEVEILTKPRRFKVKAINDQQSVIAWDSEGVRERNAQRYRALWELALGVIPAIPKELA